MTYDFRVDYQRYLWLLEHDGRLWIENAIIPGCGDSDAPFHCVADVCSMNDR